MAYRKILVPLRGNVADAHVLKAAFDVAKAFGSHLAGVYVKPDPTIFLQHLGGGVSARIRQEILDAANEDAKRAADAAHSAFVQAASAADVAVHPQTKADLGVGASFQRDQGMFEGLITEEARLSDLTVFDLSAKAKDLELRAAVESVLLNARRPLLLVPNEAAHIVGAKAVIGWDGGAAAANAVVSAVPLLKRAEEIEILSVTSNQTHTVHTDQLCAYLRLQGKTVVARSIPQGSRDTAEALFDTARSSGAGLLVIGGYGHSRLRELVLGGVTRYVFANPVLPVFMAH